MKEKLCLVLSAVKKLYPKTKLQHYESYLVLKEIHNEARDQAWFGSCKKYTDEKSLKDHHLREKKDDAKNQKSVLIFQHIPK